MADLRSLDRDDVQSDFADFDDGDHLESTESAEDTFGGSRGTDGDFDDKKGYSPTHATGDIADTASEHPNLNIYNHNSYNRSSYIHKNYNHNRYNHNNFDHNYRIKTHWRRDIEEQEQKKVHKTTTGNLKISSARQRDSEQSEHLIMSGKWEEQELDFIRQTLRADRTLGLLDLGAGLGVYTVAAVAEDGLCWLWNL
nr:hypothetical protein BaRGS_033896 [Batillaria attramentaria]